MTTRPSDDYQCYGYVGDPGASAPRCESYRGHPGDHFIRPLPRDKAPSEYSGLGRWGKERGVSRTNPFAERIEVTSTDRRTPQSESPAVGTDSREAPDSVDRLMSAWPDDAVYTFSKAQMDPIVYMARFGERQRIAARIRSEPYWPAGGKEAAKRVLAILSEMGPLPDVPDGESVTPCPDCGISPDHPAVIESHSPDCPRVDDDD